MPQDEIKQDSHLDALDIPSPETDTKKQSAYDWENVGGLDVAPEQEKTTSESDVTSAPVSDNTGKDWYDAELRNWSQQLGFSEEEAQAYGSEDALLRAMSKVQEVEARYAGRQQSEPTDPVPANKPQDPKPQSLDLKDLYLPNDGTFDEALTSRFNSALDKLHGHYAGQVEQLQKAIGGLVLQNKDSEQDRQQRFIQEFERTYDDVISGFVKSEPSLEAFLGKDTPSKLNPNSREFAEHRQIVEQYAVLRRGYQGSKKAPSDKDMILQAARLVLGDRLKSSTKKDLAAKLNARAKQAIGANPGRSTSGGTLKDRQADADRFILEKQRAMGLA